MEWFLFLPQIRLGMADLVERAQVAEASGFDGIAFIDHLQAPGAEGQPILEAMTVAGWVAARTSRLRIGHLVLCDAFRHPAVLAKQASTLQEASEGRFELGLGSGSVPGELTRFDITQDKGAQRRERLSRTLDLLGHYHGDAAAAEQVPRPSVPIPLVLGGTSPGMLELVRRHATWWNAPVTELEKVPELAGSIGTARISVQQLIGFVGADADPQAVREQGARRFGYLIERLVCGDADHLISHFAALADSGVQRIYLWFSDSAKPQTLAEFGETVINRFPAPGSPDAVHHPAGSHRL